MDLAAKLNASHRAEVMKLFIYRTAQRQGIAKTLLNALDLAAKGADGNLLILDKWQIDPSEHHYLALGFRHAGVIPQRVNPIRAGGSLLPHWR